MRLMGCMGSEGESSNDTVKPFCLNLHVYKDWNNDNKIRWKKLLKKSINNYFYVPK